MVIVDITGVSVVDDKIADGLLRAARAGKLLGAEMVLTGIRPEVAQMLVALGLGLGGLGSCPRPAGDKIAKWVRRFDALPRAAGGRLDRRMFPAGALATLTPRTLTAHPWPERDRTNDDDDKRIPGCERAAADDLA